MKRLLNLFISFISIIKIFFNTSKSSKKNLLFYFPIRIYNENIFDLIKVLKKKYNVILIYNASSKSIAKNYSNSYFFDFSLARFIFFRKKLMSNINIFISSYLSYIYPPNSKNIYMSHDIYDAPMINRKFEKQLFLRIGALDFIFCSSEISKNYLRKNIDKFKKNSKTKIINTGYIKLDHNLKKIKKSKPTNTILIAPGYSLNYQKYNIYSSIEKIITRILDNTNQKLIFRPHPLDLTIKGDLLLINKIIDKYKNNKKFIVNLAPSYLKEFQKSDILITDLTSTAYTYAFSTLKPVIFFSKKEHLIAGNVNFNHKFFTDRTKVGSIVSNVDNIIDKIKFLNNKKKYYHKKIKTLRLKRIENINISIKKTKEAIDKVAKY